MNRYGLNKNDEQYIRDGISLILQNSKSEKSLAFRDELFFKTKQIGKMRMFFDRIPPFDLTTEELNEILTKYFNSPNQADWSVAVHLIDQPIVDGKKAIEIYNKLSDGTKIYLHLKLLGKDIVSFEDKKKIILDAVKLTTNFFFHRDLVAFVHERLLEGPYDLDSIAVFGLKVIITEIDNKTRAGKNFLNFWNDYMNEDIINKYITDLGISSEVLFNHTNNSGFLTPECKTIFLF